jgi:hypothetical protein
MEKTANKPQKNSDSDEEVPLDEEQTKMWSKIDDLLKEYYLTAFQTLACKKFIKDKVANPEDKTVSRCRDWMLMKLSGQSLPKKYHPR